MTVLVLGGGGFLGAWTVGALVGGGHEVRVFDAVAQQPAWRGLVGAEIPWITGDITDAAAVDAAMAGCSAVINLAGVLTPACMKNPVLGAGVNLIGMLNVFQAALNHGLGFVAYASSAGVFGPENPAFPEPHTHYGAFKLACEGSARAWFADHGIASLGLRPFVVYGPGREVGGSAGPSLACKAAATGRPFTIPFTGLTGFVFARDVAAAFAAAIDSPPPGAQVANMAGITATVETFVGEIRRQVPQARIECAGPGLPVVGKFDGDDISAIFPAIRPTPLDEGIAATIDHYRPRDGAAFEIRPVRGR